jgi:hypothetical protein
MENVIQTARIKYAKGPKGIKSDYNGKLFVSPEIK